MAVCGLRTLLLIVCVIELIVTIQRQVFDFMGYMWLPIIANFLNILLIIFGSFGAVQYISKYLIAYAIWSFMWLTWNIFLISYYLNLGTLNRESGLLSLGTGSVSWWEGNGWGCQPVWGEVDGPGTWRPVRVEGCFFQWDHVELAQSAVALLVTATALPLVILLALRSFKKPKPSSDKSTLSRNPVYTIELSPTETNISETSLKPMTPRRVKRRSGSRGNSSSVRRSRRSYRNAGYLASNASLGRDSRPSRPTSAHSSYSNFHAARPASYHAAAQERAEYKCVEDPPEPAPPIESVYIVTNRSDTVRSKKLGYDVAGPYKEPNPPRRYETHRPAYDNIGRADSGPESPGYQPAAGYEWPPPPAPPYSARATPQAPGPPAYQPHAEAYQSHAEAYQSHAEAYQSHAEAYQPHAEVYQPHAEPYKPHTEAYPAAP